MRPVTEEQWQDAVDTADALLKLSIGQLFKLVKGVMPVIDVEECVMILAEGAERNIYPHADITALIDATDALLQRCEKELPQLNTDAFIGQQLWTLRCTALLVKVRRMKPHVERKVS